MTALARALQVVLDADAPGATSIGAVLDDMAAGEMGARTAAERLGGLTESLVHADAAADAPTALIPVVARAAAPTPTARPTVVTGVGALGPRRGRWGTARRSTRIVALTGSVLTLAAASGLVLWAAEGSATLPAREEGVATAPPPRPAAAPPVVSPAPADDPSNGSSSRRSPRERTADDPVTSVRETTPVEPLAPTTLARPPVVLPPPPTVPPTVPRSVPSTPPTGPTTGPTQPTGTTPPSTTTSAAGTPQRTMLASGR